MIFRPLEKGVQGGELGATAVLCAAMAARRVLLRIGVVRFIRCCELCECVVCSVVKSRQNRIDSQGGRCWRLSYVIGNSSESRRVSFLHYACFINY